MKIALLFLALVSCSYARLGEGREELVTRLGSVQSESQHFMTAQGQITALGPALFFKKDQWRIQCSMVDGHCASIAYSKTGDWTAEQIAIILDNNAQGGKWTERRDSTKMVRSWTRKDGGSATWKFTGAIELTSPAYFAASARREAELKAKAEKKPEL